MLWITVGVVAGAVMAVVVVGAWLRRRRARHKRGPVSIAIFRTRPRGFTEADIRGAVRRALGVEADVKTLPFDANTKGLAIVTESLPPLAVIDSARGYLDPGEVETVAAGCEDPRLREAIRTHAAWVSIDAMGIDRLRPREDRVLIYQRLLGKIAAELLDDDSLVLYAPAEGRFGRVEADTGARLAAGEFAQVFGDDSLNAPIIQVEDDDKAINAAIATAQRRLPEFLEAVERLGDKAEALVKVRFVDDEGEGEHMWAKVLSVRAGVVTAEVVNRPGNPKLPGEGAVVTIDNAAVSDWAYLDAKGKPQGMFVERVLRERM
jgi:uncharacterized protein YegJ (DUF2314 family)